METYTPPFCEKFDSEPFKAQFMVLKPDINFQCQLYILSMEVKYEKASALLSQMMQKLLQFTPWHKTFKQLLFDTIHEYYS